MSKLNKITNILKYLSTTSLLALLFSAVAFATTTTKDYELYMGTFKSMGSCPLFGNGAVVEFSYDESILTRYENPKFAPGLIIQSWWYPQKGYGNDIIHHKRRYAIPMINVGGWYVTSFQINNEKMRYQVTEKPDQSSPLMVRKIVELFRGANNSILMKAFYGMNPPREAEFLKNNCQLVTISKEEFEKIKYENGPYTSGDSQ